MIEWKNWLHFVSKILSIYEVDTVGATESVPAFVEVIADALPGWVLTAENPHIAGERQVRGDRTKTACRLGIHLRLKFSN